MPIDGGRATVRRWLAAAALLWMSVASAQSLESVLAPGPVSQAHEKNEHECKSCHLPFDRAAQDRLCLDCHKDVGQDIRQHRGWHGRRELAACRTCHAEHKGRGAQIAAFDSRAFDHKGTDFVLLDKHQAVACKSCHPAGKRWREAPAACAACHAKDDVHKGSLGRECADCHDARSWKQVSAFDHGRTRFALTGRHADAKCEDCHRDNRFRETPRSCVGCHQKDDEHKGQFGERCETCHGTKGWKPSSFNHDTDTRYLLKDSHRTVACTACHTGPLHRQKLGSACVDCHQRDDKHEGALGRECASCHNEKGWKAAAGFDHDKTRFPLLGAHQKTACASCHRDARYRETPQSCIACHRQDDRHAGTLGERCADCHVERDWKTVAGRFDHQRTRFPLRNAHARPAVKCQDCHESASAMRNTASDCIACHRRDDRHEGSQGTKCATCHTDLNWRVERFDHSRTGFPLVGRHAVATCRSCHLSLRLHDVASDCASCHRKDDTHKGTLGAKCDGCHNERAWPLWIFDHQRMTRYTLEGAHRTLRCDACHRQPAPPGKAIAVVLGDCNSCHRKDDVHDGRFGRQCELCHATDRWAAARRR